MKQHFSDGPAHPFQILAPSEVSYWHVEIRDAICGDCPEFILPLRKVKARGQYTPREVACRAAGELNEGRGLVILVLWEMGTPTFSAVFVSNGTFVFCVRSSDPTWCPPVDPTVVRSGGRPSSWKGNNP